MVKITSVTGAVAEALPNGMFRIALDSGHDVIAHVPGQLRIRVTRLLPGDRVRVELSPVDSSRGRITDRLRS